MVILQVVIWSFISAFIGYLIGRIGDNYINFWIGDPHWTPDHWIYGLILMIIGPLFFRNYWGLYIFSFGLGHLVSDLKDFLNLKFYGSDNKTKAQRRFWHID
jgi:hypothetical protein